jgi:hypothetical protein
MPTTEPTKRLQPEKRQRPKRPALLTDYIGPPVAPSGVPSDLEAYVLGLISSGAVQDRIQRELAASPTARLTIAIHDLDPRDATKYAFLTHSAGEERYFSGAVEGRVQDPQAVPVNAPPAPPRRLTPAPTDSFVACLHETCDTKGEDAALDYMYEVFHPLIIKDRDYARAERILSQVNVDSLPASVLTGLLMTTYAHKTNLGARDGFVSKVKARVGQLTDGAEIAPYLADLE